MKDSGSKDNSEVFDRRFGKPRLLATVEEQKRYRTSWREKIIIALAVMMLGICLIRLYQLMLPAPILEVYPIPTVIIVTPSSQFQWL